VFALSSEQKFYESLKNIFTGEKIEGKSGYINLMKIKSKYFNKIILPNLTEDINLALKLFPNYRDDLFDKLYNFFNCYFSESGSIYFRYTSLNQNIYEKIYLDDKDVILFWKTHPLYYVKTDKIFKGMEIEIEGIKFVFDVSELENKKSYEKREVIYKYKGKKDDITVILSVFYANRGRKTKVREIIKELKKDNIKIDEQILKRAFRIFEKQTEVDYFINKNARKFLREQFNIWLYQYFFKEEDDWAESRIKQMQVLKKIVYKIIDFIGQFEEELVKIWKKPKFVINSNYVITLDRILANGTMDLIKKITDHKNFIYQVEEWINLGIVAGNFKREDIFNDLRGDRVLNKNYNFLPIDTKYFKDLEFEIISLFQNLDESLDGWLIKSENYQALNTILPKFKEKVNLIYIDPPFNKEKEADYFYSVKFKDSIWISMLENRTQLAKDFLGNQGSILVRCDYNGNMYVRLLLNKIFGAENFRNEIVVGRTKTAFYLQTISTNPKYLNPAYDNLYWYSKSPKVSFPNLVKGINLSKRKSYWKDFKTFYERKGYQYELLGVTPGAGCSWMWKKEEAFKAVKNYQDYLKEFMKTKISLEEYWQKKGMKIKFIKKEDNKIKYWLPPIKKVSHNNWIDLEGYSRQWNFLTENSENLLKRVLELASNEGDIVMDFFLGSGTTTAVAHKLRRKWIGIEMGDHFYDIILPRMKKVLFYDKTGISKDIDVKKKYNKNEAGGFFKYYELEQYEDVLRNVKYYDSEKEIVNESTSKNIYENYIFIKDLKLIDILEMDYKNDKIKANLSKLYKNIDIIETISNQLGCFIKKIYNNEIELDNGRKINLDKIDYKILKPLIWW